jgi:type IV pilus assembly protein PilB
VKRKKLGEVLQERGKISAPDLAKIISEQQGKVIRLGELMLQRGTINKPDLTSALEEVTNIPYCDSAKAHPSPEALGSIAEAIARRCCALPLERQGSRLIVVMAEPQNLVLIDELRFTSGTEIVTRFGFRDEILQAIATQYASSDAPPAAGDEPAADSGDSPAPKLEFISTSSRQASREAIEQIQAEIQQKRSPAVRVVSQVIWAALERQASDIHIEPRVDDTIVRVRVDGVLRDLLHVPRTLQNALVSRIKILSDMDIAERRAPQDGRFVVAIGERQIDMRVSSLPTQYGEKVVMRLLESQAPLATFEQLGFPPQIEEGINRVLAMPQGMLLVTGPTGSGKSTTLYSALIRLRKPAVNIITVEDPVEYVLPGINQVLVNTRAGLTFASCIRSILRQDPNVIMIGEIRDHETAEIAMKAAQTGHMVLSTLHTNDSLSAVIRLLDLDIPSYLIAASVSGILGQRLVRRLCKCHIEQPARPEYRARLAELGVLEPADVEYLPVGCAVCDQTGYKGRVGIYELLLVDEAVRGAIRENRQVDAIRDAARSNGMKLMQDDALEKVREGITTLDEVLRVVPFETAAPSECSSCGQPVPSAYRFCPHCGATRAQGKESTLPRELVSDGALRP